MPPTIYESNAGFMQSNLMEKLENYSVSLASSSSYKINDYANKSMTINPAQEHATKMNMYYHKPQEMYKTDLQ